MLTYTADDLEKIFREENINPDELQNMVVEKLTKNNLKLATAESCTGGLLSGRITAVSGASEVFDCGVCSYANEIKHKVLGVSEETLNTLGAVSSETALQMAEGVKNLQMPTSAQAPRVLQGRRAEQKKNLSDLFMWEFVQIAVNFP